MGARKRLQIAKQEGAMIVERKVYYVILQSRYFIVEKKYIEQLPL
jgi:hypothetical protein